MDDRPTEPTFDGVERDVEAGRRAAVVLAALDLGLFGALAEGPMSADDLAHALSLPVRRLSPLLEALAALDYLERNGERYLTRPAAAAFLQPGGTGYRGDELHHWLRVLRGWSWLSEVVRCDRPRFVGRLDGPTPSAELHKALAARGRRSSKELASIVGVESVRSVLDLGSGMGSYSATLLEAAPGARATLVDKPEVIRMAAEHLGSLGLRDRVTLVGGDLADELPHGEFDLILIANVLHIYGRQFAQGLVSRAARRLARGGRLVVRDIMARDDRTGPPGALLFGVHMSVFSEEGRVYALGETLSMVKAAGLDEVHSWRLDGDPDSAVVVGRNTGGGHG